MSGTSPGADASGHPGAAHQVPLPRIPGYRDLVLHRRGSSAEVYRATMERLDRTVAIKLLRLDELTTYQQFQQELETAMRLSVQPHVVRILDTGTVDGRPYLAMEFCQDGSYAEIVAAHGPLSISDTVDVGTKIAEALHAAHEAGFIHRDVTPGNVLRSQFGPALADFGIARRPGELSGTVTLNKLTPHHAAPEALLRQPQSVRSDLYSLGSTLWHLLVGHPPFAQHGERNPDPFTYRERALHRPAPLVPRPDVPVWLQTEIARAMAKRPEDRHPSAAAFGEALRRGWAGWKGEPWRPPASYPPLGRTAAAGTASGTVGSDAAAAAPGAAYPPTAPPEWPEPGGPAPSSPAPTAPPEWPEPSSPAPAAPLSPAAAGSPGPQSVAPLSPAGMAAPAPETHRPWMRPVSGAPVAPPGSPVAPPGSPAAPPGPPAAPSRTHPEPGGYPAPAGPVAPRRRVPVISFVVAGIVGMLLGALVFAGLRWLPAGGDADPGAGASPDTTQASISADKAPTGVRIDDRGSTVVISWTDHTGRTAPHYIVGGPRGASPRAMTQVEKGVTEVTIEALNPDTDYCFTVIAVISVDEVAPSTQACTDRT